MLPWSTHSLHWHLGKVSDQAVSEVVRELNHYSVEREASLCLLVELFFRERLSPPLPSGHGQLCLQIGNLLLQADNHLCREKWKSTRPPLANTTSVAANTQPWKLWGSGVQDGSVVRGQAWQVQSLGPRYTVEEGSDPCRLSSELYICIKCVHMVDN